MCIDLVCSSQNKVHPPLLLCPLQPQGSGSLAPQKMALASGQGQMSGSKRAQQIFLLSSLLVIDWIFMKLPSATRGFLGVFVLWCNENQVSSRYHFGDESFDLRSLRQTGATSAIPRNGLMGKKHPERGPEAIHRSFLLIFQERVEHPCSPF